MVDKPDTCKGCPLYGDGRGFVPGFFVEGAELLIVGQNPGEQEEKAGVPLVGATGTMLNKDYLPLTGVDIDRVAKDNAIRCRWHKPGDRKKGNELPKGKMLDEAIECCRQYDYVPDTVRLIMCMGVVALAKFNPQLKQFEWRGHLLPHEGE